MRISLIFPNITEEREEEGIYPPLGIAYIASALQAAGHEVEIIDLPIMKPSPQQLVSHLQANSPQVIGVSLVTYCFDPAMEVLRLVKSALPETILVAGGPHLNVYPKETLKRAPEIDIGVIGEGERTVVELLEVIGNNGAKPLGEGLKGVKGIVYREEGEPVVTPPREHIEDLDSIPFPARELLPNTKYRSTLVRRKPFTTLISSRGCPFPCTYCYATSFGKLFRGRGAKNVVDEMEECVTRFGVKEFLFYDDTFTVNKQRVMDICQDIIDRRLDVIWDIRTRVDTVTQELIETMRKAGCARVNFGVESGDDEVLRAVRRKTTLEQMRNSFRWAKGVGMETFGYFILGFPYDTAETMKKTIDLALELDPDYAAFSLFMFHPRSAEYVKALEGGLIEDYWAKYTLGELPPALRQDPFASSPRIYYNDGMNLQVAAQAVKRANQAFYLRPRYIMRRLLGIRGLHDLRRNIRGAFHALH